MPRKHEVISEAVNRRRLLEFLNSPEQILKDEDYPEFRDGAEAWVRKMRAEDFRLEREKLEMRAAEKPTKESIAYKPVE